MAKAKETQRLVITQKIDVGSTTIEVHPSTDIVTEIAQLDNGAVQPLYTSKINGMCHRKDFIILNAKLIWQKAQQQQK